MYVEDCREASTRPGGAYHAPQQAMRVGKIAFSNCEPIYHGFRSGRLPQPFELTSATPANLAEMLGRGELDLSPVSSTEYLANRHRWELLPGLCVASFGAVESVLVLSKLPFTELDGRLVHLSRKSRTSNMLAPSLLHGLFGVRPRFVLPGDGATEHPDAYVAIGDEALLARSNRNGFAHVLDMGQAWNDLTGKSLVFAVWVVRREFKEGNPKLVEEVHRLLIESKRLGQAHLDEVARHSAHMAGLTPEGCERYLRLLRFDLDGLDQEGLARMDAYLTEAGLIPGPERRLREVSA